MKRPGARRKLLNPGVFLRKTESPAPEPTPAPSLSTERLLPPLPLPLSAPSASQSGEFPSPEPMALLPDLQAESRKSPDALYPRLLRADERAVKSVLRGEALAKYRLEEEPEESSEETHLGESIELTEYRQANQPALRVWNCFFMFITSFVSSTLAFICTYVVFSAICLMMLKIQHRWHDYEIDPFFLPIINRLILYCVSIVILSPILMDSLSHFNKIPGFSDLESTIPFSARLSILLHIPPKPAVIFIRFSSSIYLLCLTYVEKGPDFFIYIIFSNHIFLTLSVPYYLFMQMIQIFVSWNSLHHKAFVTISEFYWTAIIPEKKYDTNYKYSKTLLGFGGVVLVFSIAISVGAVIDLSAEPSATWILPAVVVFLFDLLFIAFFVYWGQSGQKEGLPVSPWAFNLLTFNIIAFVIKLTDCIECFWFKLVACMGNIVLLAGQGYSVFAFSREFLASSDSDEIKDLIDLFGLWHFYPKPLSNPEKSDKTPLIDGKDGFSTKKEETGVKGMESENKEETYGETYGEADGEADGKSEYRKERNSREHHIYSVIFMFGAGLGALVSATGVIFTEFKLWDESLLIKIVWLARDMPQSYKEVFYLMWSPGKAMMLQMCVKYIGLLISLLVVLVALYFLQERRSEFDYKNLKNPIALLILMSLIMELQLIYLEIMGPNFMEWGGVSESVITILEAKRLKITTVLTVLITHCLSIVYFTADHNKNGPEDPTSPEEGVSASSKKEEHFLKHIASNLLAGGLMVWFISGVLLGDGETSEVAPAEIKIIPSDFQSRLKKEEYAFFEDVCSASLTDFVDDVQSDLVKIESYSPTISSKEPISPTIQFLIKIPSIFVILLNIGVNVGSCFYPFLSDFSSHCAVITLIFSGQMLVFSHLVIQILILTAENHPFPHPDIVIGRAVDQSLEMNKITLLVPLLALLENVLVCYSLDVDSGDDEEEENTALY